MLEADTVSDKRTDMQAHEAPPTFFVENPDIVLVGSGIMSATLAVMLKRLEPRLRIQMVEVTPELAREASDGWNNAGTGHAGICEMSYTPARDEHGRVPIDRALQIFEQFEHSKQFWASATTAGIVGEPSSFIRAVPHLCFVKGPEDIGFLRDRHAAMATHHFFRGMTLTTDPELIAHWAPLVMEGRGKDAVAATAGDGTEVDYGMLARRMCGWLAQQEHCGVAAGWKVTKLHRESTVWKVMLQCTSSGEERAQFAKFVFVGAGGGSLPLLQTAGIHEAAGLAGFPIGGQWLVCDDQATCNRHDAKVYGATPPSSPSLGAGHLDARQLNGRRHLLFGPFASWTTRFLKSTGRLSDLPLSIRPGNIAALLLTGVHNRLLLKYLIAQGLQSMESRMLALREFYPNARSQDWRLVEAGIRVQTLKVKDRGAIYFGTEIFSSADRSVAALLGASPGASVSVNIALRIIQNCHPHLLASPSGLHRMKQMLPTFDTDLRQQANACLFEQSSDEAHGILNLNNTRKITPKSRHPR